MDKREALAIFAGAIIRELLRDDEEARSPSAPRAQPPPDPGPGWAQPQFDFDESADFCVHAGVYVPKADCPEHGPSAEMTPSPEELDDLESEEVPAPIARARRLAEAKRRREAKGRVYAEDLPMSGMAPPDEDP